MYSFLKSKIILALYFQENHVSWVALDRRKKLFDQVVDSGIGSCESCVAEMIEKYEGAELKIVLSAAYVAYRRQLFDSVVSEKMAESFIAEHRSDLFFNSDKVQVHKNLVNNAEACDFFLLAIPDEVLHGVLSKFPDPKLYCSGMTVDLLVLSTFMSEAELVSHNALFVFTDKLHLSALFIDQQSNSYMLWTKASEKSMPQRLDYLYRRLLVEYSAEYSSGLSIEEVVLQSPMENNHQIKLPFESDYCSFADWVQRKTLLDLKGVHTECYLPWMFLLLEEKANVKRFAATAISH